MVAPLEVDSSQWVISRLLAAMDGVRVAARTPPNLQTKLPFVQVVRAGGGDDGYVLDEPRFVFNCFDATPTAANALAIRVGAALRGLRGVRADSAYASYVSKIGQSDAYPTDQTIAQAVAIYELGVVADTRTST